MSLIVNEKRLPATVKRLFRNSVSEIVGELLQNAQRAGAKEIHFHFDREAQTIVVRDDGSGIFPDTANWARVLRMADSFYSNEQVEANQKPMGVGLLSLFALDAVKSVSINSHGKFATVETNLLWESEDYWATWTDLIADAPETINGFELTVKYEEPEATFSYNRLAHKFEYALTKFGDGGSFAPPRGYQGFLKIFLDGNAVDTTLPAECVPNGCDLLYDGFYENNRLRIGQSANPYRTYTFVVWYGQVIKLNSEIPFLLEVKGGSPVTPLAPTRTSLVDDRKLENLRRFVEDATFAALADESAARKIKPTFVERL
ncbi:MAG: ATP-binding protein, partial [Saprospiraceae bacterium]|nr:ATP-binding protein [Pyrinomonadaceae bacterium]